MPGFLGASGQPLRETLAVGPHPRLKQSAFALRPVARPLDNRAASTVATKPIAAAAIAMLEIDPLPAAV